MIKQKKLNKIKYVIIHSNDVKYNPGQNKNYYYKIKVNYSIHNMLKFRSTQSIKMLLNNKTENLQEKT
jgi:hypothetical protein